MLERQLTADLESLNLKNIDLQSTGPYTKRSISDFHNNRTLMRLYLSKDILLECLETFDIFK